MMTLGLLGGMSWESTIEYYRIINQRVRARLGGYHSAPMVVYSFDFQEIEQMQRQDAWDEAADRLVAAAARLEDAGAECLLLCTNTMHRVAERIRAAARVPFLDIADATAAAIGAAGHRRVGLLGTRYTMEQQFYRGRLAEHGFEVCLPDAPERADVNRIIYEELVQGIVTAESKARYLDVIRSLERQGAQAVILGCTEIELLVKDGDASVPLFETTRLHAELAADVALGSAPLPPPPVRYPAGS
jgi:aspartate racemase